MKNCLPFGGCPTSSHHLQLLLKSQRKVILPHLLFMILQTFYYLWWLLEFSPSSTAPLMPHPARAISSMLPSSWSPTSRRLLTFLHKPRLLSRVSRWKSHQHIPQASQIQYFQTRTHHLLFKSAPSPTVSFVISEIMTYLVTSVRKRRCSGLNLSYPIIHQVSSVFPKSSLSSLPFIIYSANI